VNAKDWFETEVADLLRAFDAHECTVDEYMAGLRYAIGELEIALQAAKET